MVLKNEIFGRGIVLVGDDSRLQNEWLRRFEFAGSQDEIGSQTAREDVARRAACEKQQAGKHEDWFVPHHFGYAHFHRSRIAGSNRNNRGGFP